MSVSRTEIILEADKTRAVIQLKRHLAPKTVGDLLAALPIEGNAHFGKNMTYVKTPVKSGLERAKTSFEKGEVAFWPHGGVVCIFTEKTGTRQMSPIGKIVSGTIEAKPGSVIRIYAGT